MKNVIFSSYCPKTDTHALVQEENDCVYLYLYIRPEQADQQIRACWVRNYSKAIDAVDNKSIDKGLQPRMPKKVCAHPDGAAKLDPNALSIVFFEDGDGAALYDSQRMIAAIPGMAASGEFVGYAADAVGSSPFAWELGDRKQNDIFEKAEKAREFWESCTQNANWEKYRDEHLMAIEQNFGTKSEYLVIDNGHFPPKAIVVVENEQSVRLFTIGVSLMQQPTVDQWSEEPEKYHRFELAMSIEKAIYQKNKDQFIAYMVGVSDIPWNYTTFLADGHTLLFDIDKYKKQFSNAILLEGFNFSENIYKPFRNEQVNLLWIVPISSKEQKFAEEKGNEELMKKAKKIKNPAFRTFDGENKFSL